VRWGRGLRRISSISGLSGRRVTGYEDMKGAQVEEEKYTLCREYLVRLDACKSHTLYCIGNSFM
jgi:hypothetical protein